MQWILQLCDSLTPLLDCFLKSANADSRNPSGRKVAGSYVASNLVMDADKVKLDDKDGTLKVYEDNATLSGNPVYRFFCSKDGK